MLASPKSSMPVPLFIIWPASVECTLESVLLMDSHIASILDSLHGPLLVSVFLLFHLNVILYT